MAVRFPALVASVLLSGLLVASVGAATPVRHYAGHSGGTAQLAMSFDVVGGAVVRFVFVNRCPGLANGTPVIARIKIVRGGFSYRDQQFTITGTLLANGTARGTAHDRTGDCDSGTLSWTARLRSGAVTATGAEKATIVAAFGDPPSATACLDVWLDVSWPVYAAVRFDSTKPTCLRWASNGVTVLQRGQAGRWRQVFAGSSYRCPVARIPPTVQRDLGVCPRR